MRLRDVNPCLQNGELTLALRGRYWGMRRFRSRIGFFLIIGQAPVTISGCALSPNVAPTAVAGADRAAVVGETITFDGSLSVDPDGTIVDFSWDFGDGTSRSGVTVAHVYAAPGAYSATLTVTDDRGATDTATVSVQIHEATEFAITVLVDPAAGGSVTLDPPGGVYAGSTTVVLAASPAAGFLFGGYFDESGAMIGSELSFALTVSEDLVVTARFEPDPSGLLSLMVNVQPELGGTVTLDPPGGMYPPGTMVTLTADAAEGFTFARYTGDISGTNAVASILLSADTAVVAEFNPILISIITAVEPPGAGSVALSPPGGVYDYGTTVTATAMTASGYVFDSFSDVGGNLLSGTSPYSFSAEADVTLVARFDAMYMLTVTVTPQGAGAVALQPAGGSYRAGTVVTLTATAAPGYAFLHYSGDATGASPSVDVTMNADRSITAEFQAWTPQIGNPRNLVVTGFAGSNVSEFDRFDGALLGEIVPSGSGELSFAGGVAFGPDGNLYVVSIGVISDSAVLRYNGANGAFVDEFAMGSGVGFLALTFMPGGDLLVGDSSDNSVKRFGANGTALGAFIASGVGGLDNPVGLTYGPDGRLYVVSKDTDRILVYDGASGAAAGVYADLAPAGYDVPVDLTFDENGHLFVSVSGDESVVRIAAGTQSVTTFVAPGAGGLGNPGGLRFHPDTGVLLVVSQDTNSVLSFNGETGAPLGTFATGADGDSLFFLTYRPD